MLHPALSDRLSLALRCAREAGDLTLSYFRTNTLGTERKGDGSHVTIADREAEKLMRSLIQREFPNDSILGEEWGETAPASGASDFRWVLDPIDGTASFVHGVPLYGTLIGIDRLNPESGEREGVIGVCRNPALGEMVYAARGTGAWYTQGDAKPIRTHVSDVASAAEGTWTCTSLDYFVKGGVGPVYPRLQDAFEHTRGWSDCYGITLLATGRVEAVIEPLVKVWDICAAQPIIEEAGGKFTDWRGRRSITSGNCVMSNGKVHEAAMRVVGA
jgi:histidinol phosphatase-like enzyme (inositol monophosphatase family)